MRLKTLPLVVAGAAALAFPAGALASDRNHDGLPDGWEHKHHLSLGVNQSQRDQDHDGLRNRSEFRHGTDPRRADTDRDGLDDGDEVRFGHDARDRDDDNDGRRDGDELVGTVKSFADGVLTITLANGETLAAKVTPATEIECEGARAQAASSGPGRDGDGDHGDDRGDDGGDDDHGDRGEEGERDCGTAALTPGAR